MQQRDLLLSHREREAAERWIRCTGAGEGSRRITQLRILALARIAITITKGVSP